MSRGKFYWYCPAWYAGDDPASGGASEIDNVGNDLVIELLNTDFAAPGDPRQDNFVVERIIGQYIVRGKSNAEVGDRYMHHRVYVADGDQTSVSLRNLFTQDDADSSFLWHKVEGYDGTFIGLNWGTWANGGDADLANPFMAGRLGSFDIKVGRRVEEGTSLIWHTQLNNTGILADDTWTLQMWVRCLLREG